MLLIAAFVFAFFFAANIGASGTAAAMGSAYGSGAVKTRRAAVLMVALFAVLGANLGGAEVVKTIGEGIIPSHLMTVELSVIVLMSASSVLFLANRLGVPLSTSEVTVGSLIGVGLVLQNLNWEKLSVIIFAWMALPLSAFFLSSWLSRKLAWVERKWMNIPGRIKWISYLLIAVGCYEAFSAGMNNVANSIGPLVGANLIGLQEGIFLGSLFLGLGSMLGGKVLETNGKKIVPLSLFKGSIVSFVSGSLVIGASLLGLPVPLTQATTLSIMGVGRSHFGRNIYHKPIIRQILKIWIFSPIYSLLISYSLTYWILRKSSFMAIFLLAFAIGVVFIAVYHWRKSRTVHKGKAVL